MDGSFIQALRAVLAAARDLPLTGTPSRIHSAAEKVSLRPRTAGGTWRSLTSIGESEGWPDAAGTGGAVG